MHVSPCFSVYVQVSVFCTQSLVEIAFACGGLKPGVCWAMSGRDDSSLSDVSINKVSVFTPTMTEPSSCRRPGALSWTEWRGYGGQGLYDSTEQTLRYVCAQKHSL